MLQEELKFAIEIAEGAGRILMEVYATEFDVAFKEGNSPVTIADTRANAFIVEALRERFPNDGIVAEENEDHGDALTRTRCWFVDPLDGTKEFVKKNHEFAVMIGLAIDGEAKLGVVFQPAKGKLYHGVVGAGAVLVKEGKSTPLRVSDKTNPADLTLVVSRSHRAQSTDDLVKRLGINNEFGSGSVGIKVGIISEQIADLYVHASDRASKWDACGPEAVVRAAGGRFTDASGKPFDYREDDLSTSRGILACNAASYEAVLPEVRDVLTESGFLKVE